MRELRDVLITYAAEDRERARPVVGRLREQGLCVAWDPQAPSARRRRVGRPREPVGCRPILVAQRGTTDGPGWVPVDAAEDEGRGYVVPVRLDDSNEVTAGRTAGPWVRGRPPSHPDFVEVVSHLRSILGVPTDEGPSALTGSPRPHADLLLAAAHQPPDARPRAEPAAGLESDPRVARRGGVPRLGGAGAVHRLLVAGVFSVRRIVRRVLRGWGLAVRVPTELMRRVWSPVR